MDIQKLKGSLDLAQMRAGADPSDANLAILFQAQSEYDSATNPDAEKKTEDYKPDQLDLLVDSVLKRLEERYSDAPGPVLSPEVSAEPEETESETVIQPDQQAEPAILQVETLQPETEISEAKTEIQEPITNNPLKKTATKAAAPKTEETL